MSRPTPDAVAERLHVALTVLVRRLKQTRDDAFSIPEVSALARLENAAPITPTELAKIEKISAQSLGATLDGLESRGLVRRERDPLDGRQHLVSITEKGRAALRVRRSGRAAHLSRTLSTEFSDAELSTLHAAAPLLERLAQRL